VVRAGDSVVAAITLQHLIGFRRDEKVLGDGGRNFEIYAPAFGSVLASHCNVASFVCAAACLEPVT
jgi:hypothetical protein